MIRPENPDAHSEQIINDLESAVISKLRAALSDQQPAAEAPLAETSTLFKQARQQLSEQLLPRSAPGETALRQQLAEARAELQRARDVAAAAMRARCEFLAYMSHEIRTPMTAILGFTELLQNQELSDADQSRALQTVQRNGHYLLDVINEILELSRLESGLLEIEQLKVNPLQISRDAIAELTQQADEQHNALDLELEGLVPETIETDPALLKQALLNLISNALKLTRQGRIRLTLSCDPIQETIRFSICENGLGIPTDQRQHVFQPFRQAATDTTRKRGKAGSGFTIISRIAELLHGEVSFNQDPQQGSEFTLQIATGSLQSVRLLNSEDELPQHPPAPQSFSVNSRLTGRILLVEDNLDNQRLIRFLLTRAGADVTIAVNGKAGIETALQAESPFDLILMDLQMPVMDGYEATRTLRNAGYTGQIVALTAHALTGEQDRCIEAGLDDCLTKPIDRNILIPQIAARLALSSESVSH